jgi:hypothetical protein
LSVDEFRAQFAEAAGLDDATPDAPVETTDTAEEPETETVVEDDAPVEVEAVVDEEAEAEETPDDDIAAYLAKYGGDTDAALRAAVEAQKVIGRQGAEVGELRKVAEQVGELRAMVEAQQPEPQRGMNYDISQVEEWMNENPQHIPQLAQQAIDSSDDILYRRAMSAWSEHDAVGAMDFHARKVSEANMAQLREEMAPALQQVERTQTGNQFVVAYEAAASKHDDFSQVMNSITPENIAGFPKTVLAALQSGDQASKQEVLETLYRWTKAEQAGNITQAATTAARKQQQDSRTARTDAAVASASTSQSREPTTNVDAFHEAFQASDAFRKAAGLA